MENPFDPGYFCTDELRKFGFKSVGRNVTIAKTCKIVGLANIEIGDNSRIDDFATLIATGPLILGERVHIHSYCQIGARGGVVLEDFAALASGCLIYTASDDMSGRHMVGGAVPAHFTKPKISPVTFRKHSAAFARSTILPGVTFEAGAVSCAGSLVTRDVPEWTVVGGVPAEHRINRSKRLLGLEAALADVEGVAA